MDKITHIDEKGRKYSAFSNGEGKIIIVGPPEGLVDDLQLPEPIATRLHNILFERNILNYESAIKWQNNIVGILQEVLQIDVQNLIGAFYKFEKV